MSTSAFRAIVGPPKFTASGKPVGVIVDTPGIELKGGVSSLESSYQLRLMTYRSLVVGEPLTIVSSRPVNRTFLGWLTMFGVGVVPPS